MFMSDRVHDWYEIAFGVGPVIGEWSKQTYDNIGLDVEADKSGAGRRIIISRATGKRSRCWTDFIPVGSDLSAGRWEQEDFYRPMEIYETLEKEDTSHWNHVIAGPWNHGGWSRKMEIPV
jgi:hypothetical protein